MNNKKITIIPRFAYREIHERFGQALIGWVNKLEGYGYRYKQHFL
jgi:hypothetical protein